MSRTKWTKEETILALALYCKIPFGKINKNHPQVIELSRLIGRTPSAVSMKMGNFGRFDPDLAAKGIVGLEHGSYLDKEVWDEYHCSMEALDDEVKKVPAAKKIIEPDECEDIVLPVGSTVVRSTRTRNNQSFFRSAVLSAYDSTCCITGINIPSLLIASHIKSWHDSDPLTERTNPNNGLCLNALHHEAFDNGIFTIDTDYRIIISKVAKEHYTSETFSDFFERYEGNKITLPERFLPSKEMIEYHNSKLKNF